MSLPGWIAGHVASSSESLRANLRTDRHYSAPLVLFTGALLIRSFRVNANPLWFDELYGYQLGQLGLRGIWENSFLDPHPPFYYFLQWVAAGLGVFHSEWGWRWFVVACGTISVPLVYQLVAMVTDTTSAFLASLCLLLAPAHIYFSQEARATAFVMLLAIIVTLLLVKIEAAPDQRVRRWLYTGLCTLGLWCSYNFVLIVGIQALVMCALPRLRRYALTHGLVILACWMPLLLIGRDILTQVALQHSTSAPLTARYMLQSLVAGEPLRYGFSWAHTWNVALLVGLAALGLVTALQRGQPRWGRYHVAQIVLPSAGFFVIGPLVGLRLPLNESKQFLVLLPSFCVLLGLGLARLSRLQPRWLSRYIVACGLCIIGAGDVAGLLQYWSKTKSPEGMLVLAVRDQIRGDDGIVSLDPSINAAINFYLNSTSIYTQPQATPEGYRFARSTLMLPAVQNNLQRTASMTTIRQHPRIWLFTRDQPYSEVAQALVENCNIVQRQEQPPMQVVLLAECNQPFQLP